MLRVGIAHDIDVNTPFTPAFSNASCDKGGVFFREHLCNSGGKISYNGIVKKGFDGNDNMKTIGASCHEKCFEFVVFFDELL